METPVRFHRRNHRSLDRDLVDDSGHYPDRIRGYQCLWCSHHKSTDWRDNFCSIVAFNNLSFMVSTSSLLLPPVLSNQQGSRRAWNLAGSTFHNVAYAAYGLDIARRTE